MIKQGKRVAGGSGAGAAVGAGVARVVAAPLLGVLALPAAVIAPAVVAGDALRQRKAQDAMKPVMKDLRHSARQLAATEERTAGACDFLEELTRPLAIGA